MEQGNFSKYERARILGARALQIAMDAPVLLKTDDKELSDVNYDPLRIAEKELDSGVLPISIKRPMPGKTEEDLEKIKVEEKDLSDEKKIMVEKKEEKDIAEGGEMMELANPEDERKEERGEIGDGV